MVRPALALKRAATLVCAACPLIQAPLPNLSDLRSRVWIQLNFDSALASLWPFSIRRPPPQPRASSSSFSVTSFFLLPLPYSPKSTLTAIAKMLDGNPRGDLVIKVTIACGVLETLAVFLRLLARWRSKAAFAADDWWIVATLIPSYAMLAVGTLMVTIGGGGRHAETLDLHQIETFLKVYPPMFIPVL